MEKYEAPKAVSPDNSTEGILAEPDILSFIQARNVRPESYPLIVELSHIPKDTIINGMHNFFSFNKGPRVLQALQHSVTTASSDSQRKMYELFSTFTEQYDEYASRHLVAVLERRGRGI